MNKNRNKVAAMMMVAAITVSSVAMPVEAAVSSIESVGIERGNNVYEEGDIDLRTILDKNFLDIIINNIKRLKEEEGKNIDISNGIIKQKDIGEITKLQGYPSNPTDLSGIDQFVALNMVWIDNVSKIDLSKNSLITNVNLEGNKLKTLDLKGNPELTRLNITNGNIESLDLSNNTNLKELHCGENKLKYLDLSNNTKLSFLSLDESRYTNNGIGYLKLDENVVLKNGLNESSSIKKIFEQSVDVFVDKENENEIDLAKEFPGIETKDIVLNPGQGVELDGSIIKWEQAPERSITYTYRTQGKKDGIELKVNLYIKDSYGITEGVVINKKNFPDDEFRKYLCSDRFTENHNNMPGGWNFKEGDTISAEILRKIKKIDIGENYNKQSEIKDLTGIQYFKNLTTLICSRNKIENLDLSENKNLTTLICNDNRIERLDVSSNSKLTTLNCMENGLLELVLPKSKSIKYLYCNSNKLTSIEMSKLENVVQLDCRDNDLNNLTLTGMDNLETLNCGGNELSSLEIPALPNLKSLSCNGMELPNLDVSKASGLERLECKKCGIEEINLLANTKLINIDLSYNNIKSIEKLYLQNKINLTNIDLSNNKISGTIDFGINEGLESINVYGNEDLKNIDVSSNKELSNIDIRETKVGKLNLHKYVGQVYLLENRMYINTNKKSIDLKEEFSINEDEIKNVKIMSPESGIEIKGTKLVWEDEDIKSIEYHYDCGGKLNNELYVLLMINSSEGENPDKPTNPDQGGGSGGGTTTPDQKPDQKPDEKPNKPNKPGNITSKIVGKNRYETAAKIADELVKNNVSYNSVILVNSDKSMADGLSAASLSGKKNAPILLVKKDSIPAEAMAKIEKAKNVYIIGGEGAISKKVENQLKGKNITRISGKDRYETSAKIANMLGGYKMAFIVNGAKGEADAMSVSSVAAKYGAPILLTNGKTSTHPVKAGVSYFVIGGRGVVSNQLADKYNADRIAGIDRYSTNRKVIDEFYYDSKKVYFAKGDTLVDALTASLLAKDNGMVLVSKNANHKKLEGKEAVQVGGMDFEISFE